MMKLHLIIPCIAIALLASCKQGKQQGTTDKEQGARSEEQTTRNVVKKKLHVVKEFTHLTNLSGVDIIYQQGDYYMELEGDSTLLEVLGLNFDSNLLTISMPTDANMDINAYGNSSHMKMRLSCPDLRCVSICGTGNFESHGTWRSNDIQLGVFDRGSLTLDSVECTTLSMQSNAKGAIAATNVKADEATVLGGGLGSIDLHLDVKEFVLLNDGKQKINLSGKAEKLLIRNQNDPNLTNNIK